MSEPLSEPVRDEQVPEPHLAVPEAAVLPPWAPPVKGSDVGTVSPRRRRSWLISTGILAGVLALVLIVWGLGGFHQRSDLLQRTAPLTTISVGPYQFTFTAVTAQKKKDFADRVYWQLTALGTGLTTGDVSIAPDYGPTGTFVSKDLRSGEIEIPSGVRYGTSGSYSDGAKFTPGLRPIPIRVEFEYQASYVPDQTLLFAVFQLTFSDNSLFGDQDKSWNKTNRGFDYRLPVRLLPDATT